MEETQRSTPVFGILSVVSPIVGFGLASVFRVLGRSDETDDWDYAILAGLSLLGSLILGAIFGGISLFRYEKYRVLSWIGYLLSAGPLVFLLVLSGCH